MKAVSRIAVLALGLMSGQAFAETWVAKCKDLHFRFDRSSHKAAVYLKTTNGIFQVTGGNIRFDNGLAMRAPMDGIQDGVKGPMTEIGLNRSRNIVYVLYRHPATGELKDGVFCETPVTVEP